MNKIKYKNQSMASKGYMYTISIISAAMGIKNQILWSFCLTIPEVWGGGLNGQLLEGISQNTRWILPVSKKLKKNASIKENCAWSSRENNAAELAFH